MLDNILTSKFINGLISNFSITQLCISLSKSYMTFMTSIDSMIEIQTPIAITTKPKRRRLPIQPHVASQRSIEHSIGDKVHKYQVAPMPRSSYRL